MLSIVKHVLWEKIKNRVDAGGLPRHESFDIIYDHDKVVSLRYEITESVLVEVPTSRCLLRGCPSSIPAKRDTFEMTFSVPYTQDCSIARVFMQNWPQELDDFLPELEEDLVKQWNG